MFGEALFRDSFIKSTQLSIDAKKFVADVLSRIGHFMCVQYLKHISDVKRTTLSLETYRKSTVRLYDAMDSHTMKIKGMSIVAQRYGARVTLYVFAHRSLDGKSTQEY